MEKRFPKPGPVRGYAYSLCVPSGLSSRAARGGGELGIRSAGPASRILFAWAHRLARRRVLAAFGLSAGVLATGPVKDTLAHLREGSAGNPTVQQDRGYGLTSALALAVEAVEAQHVSSSTVTSGLA